MLVACVSLNRIEATITNLAIYDGGIIIYREL